MPALVKKLDPSDFLQWNRSLLIELVLSAAPIQACARALLTAVRCQCAASLSRVISLPRESNCLAKQFCLED
jgi:hypothetical protein